MQKGYTSDTQSPLLIRARATWSLFLLETQSLDLHGMAERQVCRSGIKTFERPTIERNRSVSKISLH